MKHPTEVKLVKLRLVCTEHANTACVVLWRARTEHANKASVAAARLDGASR